MFYTIQVTKKNGEYAKQIFSFDNLKDAKANHHYFLSSAYADNNDYILGMVMDENGGIVCRDIFFEREEEQNEN
ncbi:MAG: hypothetical protein MJ086_03365 [Lachnospiraceae bacterium]|nr:hypothetical protein [Lachnospiraceae bacterium]